MLRGRLTLAGMQRLADALYTPQATVDIELDFGRDEQRLPYMRGRIDAQVTVVCQRCLQPMALDLHAEPCLGIVASESEAHALPGHYDPLLVEAPPVLLSTLVEDELLLALPVVPKHADEACLARPGNDDATQEPVRKNPFAVLAQLKSSK